MYFVTFLFLSSPEWLKAGVSECPSCCPGFWITGKPPAIWFTDFSLLAAADTCVLAQCRWEEIPKASHLIGIVLMGTQFSHWVRSSSLVEQGVIWLSFWYQVQGEHCCGVLPHRFLLEVVYCRLNEQWPLLCPGWWHGWDMEEEEGRLSLSPFL